MENPSLIVTNDTVYRLPVGSLSFIGEGSIAYKDFNLSPDSTEILLPCSPLDLHYWRTKCENSTSST